MEKSDFKTYLWYHAENKTGPDQTCAVQVRRGEACWQVQTKKASKQNPDFIYHVFECEELCKAIDWIFDRYEVSEWENGLRVQLEKDARYLDRSVGLYDHEIAQRIRYVLEKMTGKD